MSATPHYRVDDEHSGETGREIRVFGPPGTGKTTYLSGSIRATARVRGNTKVVVASFTTTAAAELGTRDLNLPRSQIGTLHSLCYRELDRPPVADELLPEWNKAHPAFPLTVRGKVDVDDGVALEPGAGGAVGDAYAQTYDNLRARMVPEAKWPRDVAMFARAWEAWKRDTGTVDFTDMIEMAIDMVPTAPGNPDVGFFDEVQDFTPLQLNLIRSWGRHMERVILAGDDDQCIFGFTGATPEAFLHPEIPDHDKIILSQSWRIPAAVHRAAEHWISQLGHRQPKLYLPRDEEGVVRPISAEYGQHEALADAVEAAVGTTIVDGDGPRAATVMVLASCAYMLDPLKHELRKRGLPFHNPYRAKRGDWNPLRPSGRGVSSKDRLLAYLLLDEREVIGMGSLSRPWTGEDVRRWAHVVKKKGIFVRGAAAAIEALPDRELAYEEVAALFADEVELEQAVTPDLRWLERNLLNGSRQGMAFPLEVARQRGAKALIDEPQVVLGTIHSTKGAQADIVFLIPDLSARGMNEWRQSRGSAAHDSVRRQFYVGMTRARHELVVCSPATALFVPPEQIIEGARTTP